MIGALSPGTFAEGNNLNIDIQNRPFNILEEGIEACLDRLLLDNVKTLFICSHTYYGIPYTRTSKVYSAEEKACLNAPFYDGD